MNSPQHTFSVFHDYSDNVRVDNDFSDIQNAPRRSRNYDAVNQSLVPRQLFTDGEDTRVITTSYNIILPCIECNDQEVECAICMCDDIDQQSGGGRLRCGHYFHNKCISQWLSTSLTCPCCRSSVDVEDY